ncbi:unnamed protein product, partial [Ectocarpus sp. 4 AP-2014]
TGRGGEAPAPAQATTARVGVEATIAADPGPQTAGGMTGAVAAAATVRRRKRRAETAATPPCASSPPNVGGAVASRGEREAAAARAARGRGNEGGTTAGTR